ncbi:unnamed protein product [Linum trigynum]|uniref:No apical meristem-associated C-terminal domain-containing protein n=1 Tax=Linum trigynum TaxID=586398 RepID=A0AAV2EST8_9ROSI
MGTRLLILSIVSTFSEIVQSGTPILTCLLVPFHLWGQGSQSSPTGFGSQSSPVEGLDDLPDEGATPFVLTRPEGRDKQKAAKKKGKVVAESSDIYTTQLLEFGNDMRERQKSRMEYENRKMNVQERRLEQEKEEWTYKRQVREREAEKWAVEKKEREAAILQQNVAILEKDLSKMTPRKKRFWRRKQNDIYGYDQDDPNSYPSDGGDGDGDASGGGDGDESGGGDGDYFPVMDY